MLAGLCTPRVSAGYFIFSTRILYAERPIVPEISSQIAVKHAL
jgi:hypothetical protein